MKDSEKLDLQDLDSVSGGFNYAQLTREELNKFNELKDHFYKVCADCEEGKIDLIVTKSVSRFARNVLDCIGLSVE